MQSTNEYVTEFGHLHLRIEEILEEIWMDDGWLPETNTDD